MRRFTAAAKFSSVRRLRILLSSFLQLHNEALWLINTSAYRRSQRSGHGKSLAFLKFVVICSWFISDCKIIIFAEVVKMGVRVKIICHNWLVVTIGRKPIESSVRSVCQML